MKQCLSLWLLMGLGTVMGFSEEKTWIGQISDSMCGADHTVMAKEHKKEGDVPGQVNRSEPVNGRDCTLACVKSGGKYVFVTGEKVYEIENQGYPQLPEHAGQSVKLSGELNADGKTIKVSKIIMGKA
jgi:hypothetical protein